MWLLESSDPSGANVMACRRMHALRSRLASTPLTLSRGVTSAATPHLLSSTSLAGEIRIARADVVFTTSERTLASAAPRVRPGTRLVHFLHTDPRRAFRSEPIMRTLPKVTAAVVPAQIEAEWFAAAVGLPRGQVRPLADFTLPGRSLLGTARPRVVLVPGQLTPDCGVLEVAEGFRLALPQLPGWQLRIAGWGPLRRVLEAFIDGYGLAPRIRLLGARADLATDYLDAGVVIRVQSDDAYGLPVLEALTAGVPVIAAATVPAVQHVVRPDVNGLVLERTDPAEIAAALIAVGDPRRRAELARGARENPSGALDAAGRAAEHAVLDSLFATASPAFMRSAR